MIEKKESENKPYLSSDSKNWMSWKTPRFHRPRFHTFEDMHFNIRRMRSPGRPMSIFRNEYAPRLFWSNYWGWGNYWRYRDMRPVYDQPITSHEPTIVSTANPGETKSEELKTEKKEPYWDGVGWEEWAYQIYDNYPEMRRYLPEWFIVALEQNNKKQ